MVNSFLYKGANTGCPFDVLKEKAIKQMEKAEEKRKAKKAPKEELPPISSYVASNSDFIRHLDNAARNFT